MRDPDPVPDPRNIVSRRQVLRTVGAAAAAGVAARAGAAAPASPPARAAAPQDAPKVLGPGNVAVTLQVNGAPRSLEIEPRVTLLDALRERLQLTGAKKVCDRGACGACTVLIDGEPRYSCMTLAIDCAGRSVETVEGLAPEGEFHPVSRAFAECDALQCGFCTPGFVVTIAHHLRGNPKPTLESVREACRGNLCRCGTYNRVFEAALLAATGGVGLPRPGGGSGGAKGGL